MTAKQVMATKTTTQLFKGNIVKCCAFIVLLLCIQTSAQVMAQTVTLKGSNLKLEKVLSTVKSQTGYSAVGNKEVFSVAKPITLDVKNMALAPFLDLVFRDQPINYEVIGHNIIVSKKNAGVTPLAPPPTYNATVELRGRIVNDKNEPIIGATVTTKGGPIGTFSNEAGYFAIYADRADATLLVTAVGYQQAEKKSDPAHPLTNNINMKVQVQELAGVVVEQVNTGYQLLNKERATGAFSKPDMEVVKNRASTMDIMERMEGLVPGMMMLSGYNTSRYNGSSTRKTVIRGTSSVLNSVDPLYVVNGVIVSDFSALNLDDVEDITVLKDAAAAAIWGARASNGVIVVTTKTGNKLKRLSVNYAGFFNYSGYPNYGKIPMMNSSQYIQAAKETFDPEAYPWESLTYNVIAPHDQILYDQYRGVITAEQANKSLDSMAAISNGEQIKDIWQRPAFTTNHTVSVAGGNSAYNFYGSLGYTGVNDNNPGSQDNSFKINFTQQVNVGNRVNISLATSLVNRISSGKNMISIGNDFLPYQLFRDENGNALPVNFLSGYADSLRLDYQKRSLINLDYYPLDEVNKGYNKRNTLFANVTANIAVSIWKGLRFSGAYGYQKAPGTSTSYGDHSLFSSRQTAMSLTVERGPGQVPIYNYPMSGGTYMTGTNDNSNWTVRNQLIYDAKPRNGKDNLTLQVGQEAQESYSYSNTSTVLGYNENLGSFAPIDWERLQNGIPGTITGYGFLPNTPFFTMSQKSRFVGYYGLASYTYNHKYSIDASWRQDYSNQFGSDLAKQNKPVWSIGGKWLISKENFMRPVSWINDLGIRATYGITGNSPYVGSAASFDALRVVSNMNQVGLIAGDALTIGTIANRGLAWEHTQNINVGIDYALLNRRLSGNINLYSRATTDLLGSMPANPFTGQSSAFGNVGKMTNKGIEVAIQSENISTKNFRWTTGLQFSYNRNRLESYAKMLSFMNTVSNRLYGSYLVGYPMNPLFAYRFAGLDNMGDPQIYVADGKVSKQPGAATMDDLKYMGTRQPPYMAGLTNTFGYKSFSLSANIVGSFGGVMYRPIVSKFTGRLAENASFSNSNYSVLFMDRWKKPGDEAFTNIPSFVAGNDSWSRRDENYYKNGDINVISSAYVKLRDVTLNYALPANVAGALKLQSFNAYLQASNFILWTANNAKVDPSWQTGGPLHSYTIGINASF